MELYCYTHNYIKSPLPPPDKYTDPSLTVSLINQMEHSKGQNLQMPTMNQLVQVIQNLQQKVQALKSQQANLETAAATLITVSLAIDTPGHCDHKAGMKPQRPVVVLPPQENMDNGPSLFDYGLNNLYNDLIDDFDPYLEYNKEYQNRTAFEDAFYE